MDQKLVLYYIIILIIIILVVIMYSQNKIIDTFVIVPHTSSPNADSSRSTNTSCVIS